MTTAETSAAHNGLTRRGAIASGLAGALAVPTLAGLASWRWRHGEGSLLLFDPSLAAGLRFAETGRAAGGRVLALAGDPVRQAQQVLRERPATIAGISRHADALLFAEVAAEAGYQRVVTLDGSHAACTARDCHPGWDSLGKFVAGAGPTWVEALAGYAANPRAAAANSGALPSLRPPAASPQPGIAFAWVLASR